LRVPQQLPIHVPGALLAMRVHLWQQQQQHDVQQFRRALRSQLQQEPQPLTLTQAASPTVQASQAVAEASGYTSLLQLHMTTKPTQGASHTRLLVTVKLW
jgi:hypothetical protein